MADRNSSLLDLSPEKLRTASPSPPLTTGTNTPRHGRSPSQDNTELHNKRIHRHSKKLSLSFPIMLPPRGIDTPSSHFTTSPTALSTHPMTHGHFFSPPSSHASHSAVPSSIAMSMPLTPPSEDSERELLNIAGRARSQSKGHVRQESTSGKFLTLLASQERRVLELKEELARAETELSALKKQWALYESGKKKDEVKGVPTQMTPFVPSHTHVRAASVVEPNTGLGLSGIDEPVTEEKLELEREKRREIARAHMMGRWTGIDNGQTANNGSKKTGQRVFSNSRHTRTLSLLTTTSVTRSERTGSLDSNPKTSLDSARQSSNDTPPMITTATTSMPSLTRANSGLEGLNFSKTYKELATVAGRKHLSQNLSPEQIVKHGKLVVDGVKDGLWNFFEDIRQATVGDEAIVETRRSNSSKHSGPGNQKLKRTMTDGVVSSQKAGQQADHDSSFWKEFGMDTPKSDKVKKDSGDAGTEGQNERDRKNVREKPKKRPSLPGRWPSTVTGEDFKTTSCPKHLDHDNGQVQTQKHQTRKSPNPASTRQPTTKTTSAPASKHQSAEHHESKSSTDSRHPPSLVADLDEDEDTDGGDETGDRWDNWDSASATTSNGPSIPGTPNVSRKRGGRKDLKQRDKEREVQWHHLMS